MKVTYIIGRFQIVGSSGSSSLLFDQSEQCSKDYCRYKKVRYYQKDNDNDDF